MSARDRVKAHVASISPYVPGKPIEELERELGISGSVKLASNENPLGPSPRAVAAVREAAANLHRYPDGASYALRAALSERLGVDPGMLVFGAGCDEILELVAKTFLGEGDEVVYAWPSFAMYPLVVQGMGAKAVAVPLDRDLVHDLDAMAAAVTPATAVVVVCNPNNPTGTKVGAEAFDRFAASLPEDVILLVDEVYVEFAVGTDFPDALAWVRRRPGTIVTRTFSKLYGLAGARIGYGITDLETASFLERARHPFNVNLLAEAAAVAALEDHEHVESTLRVTREGAATLRRELDTRGIQSWPTHTNFLLARTGEGSYEALLQRGVIVRPMDGFGLTGCVRITIGTQEENERLLKELDSFIEGAR